MTEMIERVALALEAESDKALCWQHMARVAVEAMREPTDEMVGAGAALISPESYFPGIGPTWIAMIDAALKA